MLFEPILHEAYAETIRKAFPDWQGDVRELNLTLPMEPKPFERTRLVYALNNSTENITEITVPSIRALFRGNGELVIDRNEFKNEYLTFFFPTEVAFAELGRHMPEVMITDENFLNTFSIMRRRPDGKSAGYLHDVVWQVAADFLIRYVCSQNEFQACFHRLEQSARTWRTSPTSINYFLTIQDYPKVLHKNKN